MEPVEVADSNSACIQCGGPARPGRDAGGAARAMTGDFYSILGVTMSPRRSRRRFGRSRGSATPTWRATTDAIARFKKAKQAYEALNDPVMRARYDRRGQRRPVRGGGTFFDAFANRTGHLEESGPTPGGAAVGDVHVVIAEQRSRPRRPVRGLRLRLRPAPAARRIRATEGADAPRPQAGENVEVTSTFQLQRRGAAGRTAAATGCSVQTRGDGLGRDRAGARSGHRGHPDHSGDARRRFPRGARAG